MTNLSNVRCIRCGTEPNRQFCGQVSCTCFLTDVPLTMDVEDMFDGRHVSIEAITSEEWDKSWANYYDDK